MRELYNRTKYLKRTHFFENREISEIFFNIKRKQTNTSPQMVLNFVQNQIIINSINSLVSSNKSVCGLSFHPQYNICNVAHIVASHLCHRKPSTSGQHTYFFFRCSLYLCPTVTFRSNGLSRAPSRHTIRHTKWRVVIVYFSYYLYLQLPLELS